MKLQLETIIIFVQNINRLKSFYVDLLKLNILEEIPSEWLLLQAGGCNIGLHKMGEHYPNKSEGDFKFDNNTKIVFETDQDIRSIRASLMNEKVSMKEVTTFDNYPYWLCDGEDPEGNVFQIKQRKV